MKPKKFHKLLSLIAVMATLPLAKMLAKHLDSDTSSLLASQLADWITVAVYLIGGAVATKLKLGDNLKVAELLAQQVEDNRPRAKRNDLKGVQNHGG